MIPTIEQVMKCYRIIARTEHMKTGRPGQKTIANTLRGTRKVCHAAKLELTMPITVLTRHRLDEALSNFMESGITRLSAWSYLCQFRALFAKWCLPYYKDAGWTIPTLELPIFRARPPRYQRPSFETIRRVKAWYRNLQHEEWFAATMMLEFAMRNGDVLRLTEDNFITRNDGHYLSYTPHKTELSSGRRVFWPIHKTIWETYENYGGMACFDLTDEIFNRLNHALRALGLRGTKGAYELRKLCIDHIYQKYGAEMAVSISGDDIRTISRYYADPSQPNAGAIRVIDLL